MLNTPKATAALSAQYIRLAEIPWKPIRPRYKVYEIGGKPKTLGGIPIICKYEYTPTEKNQFDFLTPPPGGVSGVGAEAKRDSKDAIEVLKGGVNSLNDEDLTKGFSTRGDDANQSTDSGSTEDNVLIEYQLEIDKERSDGSIYQIATTTFVSSGILLPAGELSSPTVEQKKYFSRKLLFCYKLDSLRHQFAVEVDQQEARQNLEKTFIRWLQGHSSAININDFRKWAVIVGLPWGYFPVLTTVGNHDDQAAWIHNISPAFQRLIFKWLRDIRRAEDDTQSESAEAISNFAPLPQTLNGYAAVQYRLRLGLSLWLYRWQLRLRAALHPVHQSLERLGASLILLALIIPMVSTITHLSSSALPSKFTLLLQGLMDWPHTFLNLPVCLVLLGVFALLVSHFSNQQEEERINLRYYRLKEDLLQTTRTRLSDENLAIQSIAPSEYGWTPLGAEKLTDILGIKEQIKSIDAVFNHWLLDKDGIVSEYEGKKRATANKVRNLLLGGGAAYVTIEVGQYIQDYRDVLQKQDMKSYLAELKSPSTTDATLQKYVESDVGSYSEVIFVFFLVLISVVIKTFFFPTKESSN